MYFKGILKCLVSSMLLFQTVTIAQIDTTEPENGTNVTEPTPTITTQLPPIAIGTIIDQLCNGLCNCPAPEANDTLTSIDCSSRMVNTVPQWNSTEHVQINGYLSISFQNNQIKMIEPINATKNVVQIINFRRNAITKISGYAFENLNKLKRLSLAENYLDKIDHQMFRTTLDKNLPLESLDLSHNNIVHIDDDAFEQLENLKELILSYNPIHTLDISTIVSLNSVYNLEKIDLSHTKLQELPINDLINPIRNLKELDISYNLLTSVPETLQNALQLKKLNLDGNPITVLSAISFISLINLEELNINNMDDLTTIYDGTFTQMVKLVNLSCSNNTKLTNIATGSFINHFGEGPKDLKLLLLNNNSLATINQETFVHLTVVKMEFNDNKLHCSCSLKWMQSEYGELTCNTPSSVYSQQLKHVDFNNVPCETDKTIIKASHVGLALGISIVAMALVGSVIFIILRRRETNRYPNAHYTKAQHNDGCDFNDDL